MPQKKTTVHLNLEKGVPSADKAVDISQSWLLQFINSNDFEFGVSVQGGWAEVLLASGAEIPFILGAVPSSDAVSLYVFSTCERATGMMQQQKSTEKQVSFLIMLSLNKLSFVSLSSSIEAILYMRELDLVRRYFASTFCIITTPKKNVQTKRIVYQKAK